MGCGDISACCDMPRILQEGISFLIWYAACLAVLASIFFTKMHPAPFRNVTRNKVTSAHLLNLGIKIRRPIGPPKSNFAYGLSVIKV